MDTPSAEQFARLEAQWQQAVENMRLAGLTPEHLQQGHWMVTAGASMAVCQAWQNPDRGLLSAEHGYIFGRWYSEQHPDGETDHVHYMHCLPISASDAAVCIAAWRWRHEPHKEEA